MSPGKPSNSAPNAEKMRKNKIFLPIVVAVVSLLFSSCSFRLIPETTPMAPIAAGTWFYDQLSEIEKSIYDALRFNAIEEDSIFVETDCFLSSEDVAKAAQCAVDALLRDRPEMFYLSCGTDGTSFDPSTEEGKNGIRIHPVLRFPGETVFSARAAFSAKAESISVAGSTEAEKALSIARQLLTAEYDISAENADTAYGALVDGQANCLGIALAFHYIASLHGLRTLVVSGTHGNAYKTLHAWNYVQLEDGRFYALDISEAIANRESLLLFGASSVSLNAPARFSERYRPSGDISGFGERVFALPPLSYYGYSLEQ